MDEDTVRAIREMVAGVDAMTTMFNASRQAAPPPPPAPAAPKLDKRIPKCPIKKTNTSLESWLEEVKMWDECLPEQELARLKYLSLLESVRSSEDSKEMQDWVETNVAANMDIESKKTADYIKETLEKMTTALVKSNLEKAAEAWMDFININRDEDESIKDYVNKFENVQTKLVNAKVLLPDIALAVQLMHKSNLVEMSKENILAKADKRDFNNLYSETKQAMRDIKTMTATANKKEVFLENRREWKGNSNLPKEWSLKNQRSDSRSRRNFRRDEDEYRRRRSQSRDSWRRGSQSRNGSREDSRYRHRRDFRSSERDPSRRRSRDSRDSKDEREYSDNYERRSRDRGTGSEYRNKVNKVHFSSYDNCYIKSENLELIKNDIESVKLEVNEIFAEEVYKEGNSNNDPFKLIVDTGCPKTVTGKKWMDSYVASKGPNVFIKRKEENEQFKFGPSEVYTSKIEHEIEVEIGKLKTTLKVSVVDADIPLLLGTDYQAIWGVVMDIRNRELKI